MGRSAKEGVVPYDGTTGHHDNCRHRMGIIFDRAESRKGPDGYWELVIHIFCVECGSSGSHLIESDDIEW